MKNTKALAWGVAALVLIAGLVILISADRRTETVRVGNTDITVQGDAVEAARDARDEVNEALDAARDASRNAADDVQDAARDLGRSANDAYLETRDTLGEAIDKY